MTVEDVEDRQGVLCVQESKEQSVYAKDRVYDKVVHADQSGICGRKVCEVDVEIITISPCRWGSGRLLEFKHLNSLQGKWRVGVIVAFNAHNVKIEVQFLNPQLYEKIVYFNW